MRRAGWVLLICTAVGCGDPEAAVEKAAARSGVRVPRVQDNQAQATPASATAAPTPAPAAPRHSCRFLTNDQASQAFGQAVEADFSANPEQCAFKVPGAGHPFTITIDNDTSGFYSLTAATGAQMVDVGDRAVWLDRVLHVVNGRRRIRVEMAEGFGSKALMLQNAKALGRAVIANSK